MSGAASPGLVLLPQWRILYGGSQTDITKDLATNFKELRFDDEIGKKATSLKLYFANNLSTATQLGMEANPPGVGQTLSASIGYQNQALTSIGSFEVDEYEFEGPPHVFIIKTIQAGITQALRTLRSVAYEGQTLTSIAKTVAARQGLTATTDAVSPDVPYQRLTQNHESDLVFLHRIAGQHGYDFQIRDKNMVFYSRTAIEDSAAAGVLVKSGGTIKHYRFTNQTLKHKTYAASEVGHWSPVSKQFLVSQATAANAAGTDTLRARERVENSQQASVKAAAYLHDANMLGVRAEIEVIGNPLYRAGRTLTINGFGLFDQITWTVEKAEHRLDRQGYLTRLHLRNALSKTGSVGPVYLPTSPQFKASQAAATKAGLPAP